MIVFFNGRSQLIKVVTIPLTKTSLHSSYLTTQLLVFILNLHFKYQNVWIFVWFVGWKVQGISLHMFSGRFVIRFSNEYILCNITITLYKYIYEIIIFFIIAIPQTQVQEIFNRISMLHRIIISGKGFTKHPKVPYYQSIIKFFKIFFGSSRKYFFSYTFYFTSPPLLYQFYKCY